VRAPIAPNDDDVLSDFESGHGYGSTAPYDAFAHDAAEDMTEFNIRRNRAATKVQDYVRKRQEKKQERYWNERLKPNKSGNTGRSARWAARVDEDDVKQKLKTEEAERKKQQEIHDEAERKLLKTQEEERKKQEALQRQETELLQKQQAALEEDARKARVELERQEALTRATNEEIAQRKALADGLQELRANQQRLLRDQQELDQGKARDDLAREQSEKLLQQQQKALTDEQAANARTYNAQKALLEKQAADDLVAWQKQEKKFDRMQDEQDERSRTLATGLQALEDAAEDAATKADKTSAAQEALQELLDRERERQKEQKHSLEIELATLLALEASSVAVLGQATSAVAVLQNQKNVLDRWHEKQRIQEAEFQKQLAVMEAALVKLDAFATLAGDLPAAGARAGLGSRAAAGGDAAAAGGDAAAAATNARLQQRLALLNGINLGLRRQMKTAGRKLAEKDRESDELYKKLGGRPAPDAPPVDPTAEFTFREYLGALDYGDWIAAMDALCLFRDTDRSYVLFQTDWQTMLHENGLLLAKIAGRAVPFLTWELSRAFFEANKGSCQLIPFWNNLYFQFGLITERLTRENLRPWGAGERERLIGWCRTVCAGGQKRLYTDKADYDRRGAKDRRVYRAMYNCCHGPLRWFWYGENDLHVDIRFLDKIMSAYVTETAAVDENDLSESQKMEALILKDVLENIEYTEQAVIDEVEFLDAEIGRAEEYCEYNYDDYVEVSDDCRDTLEIISKWKWRVWDNDTDRAVYARIYEHARQHETEDAPAAAMLWVQAVEHHRRYTLHQCPTGES